jgi:hypothetical protein
MRWFLYIVKYSLLVATIHDITSYRIAVFIVAAMKHPNLIFSTYVLGHLR